jgi:hypothetical protein
MEEFGPDGSEPIMAKKKPQKRVSRRPARDILPSAFWLSPQGAVVPVNVHAEALVLMPDLFGLEKPPHGRDEVNEAMGAVIRNGWMRGRVVGKNILSIQLWLPQPEQVSAIHDLVTRHKSTLSEIAIETVDPHGWWQFTTAEFLERAWPSGWRLGEPG